jgi:hypothetical protein
MAQPCGALDAHSIPDNSTDYDRSNSPVVDPGVPALLGEGLTVIENLAFRLGRSTQASALFFCKTKHALVDGSLDSVRASRDFIQRVTNRLDQKKQDHPVELLMTIAGAAFVVGVLTRVLGTRDDI